METRQKYNIPQPDGPQTLFAFESLPCALVKEHPDYSPPTPMEIRTLRNLMGLSQRGLAMFLGVNYTQDKGSATIRKWETPKGGANHREISYAAWRLMLIAANIVKPEDIIMEVEGYKL